MDKLLFKRILVTILLVCMLSYVIYLFVGLYSNGTIETENAVFTSVSDVITTQGYVMREEVLVKNKTNGIISYNISDGDNVSVGQNIADIYHDEFDAVARRQIKNLNNKINNLTELGNSYYKESVGLDTVNNQIENEIISILSDINNCEYSLATEDGEDLLYFINERQIITGQVKNFNKKINEYKNERDKLRSKCSDKIGSVVSDKAGYFITYVDGYEKNLRFDDITKITLDEFNKISGEEYADNYVGKIVTNPEWYIICKVNKDEALKLSKMQGNGLDVNVTIPFIMSKKIPAEIVAVNQKTRQDDGVLILSCDYMNEDISKARIESIEIETAYHYGLKISKRAIHEDYLVKSVEKNNKTIEKKKKVQGVYVLHGSEIIFKQISIDYSAKDYVICNPTPPPETLFNGETVTLYDRIVIKGDNLYDGKIIE